MNAFSQFAPRERNLIKIAGALIILLGLWQFVISPAAKASKEASTKLAAAERDYAIVSQGLSAITQTQRAPKAVLSQNGVVSAARNSSVTISRIQPAAGSALQIWLEDSPAQNVYGFIAEIDRLYEVKTQRAKLTRRSDGLIAAQFTLAPL
jgi:type II secretory pathway component PulM